MYPIKEGRVRSAHTAEPPRGATLQITRLANRSNVLPVITRSDTLTLAQRQTIRTALHRDLASAGLKWGGFDHLERKVQDSALDDDDDDDEQDQDDEGNASRESIQPDGAADGAGRGSILPFFLFSPEEVGAPDASTDTPPAATTSTGHPFTRALPWCALDALNPAHSDFARMYSSLLGPLLMVRLGRRDSGGAAHADTGGGAHEQKLKDEARDTYYERYRTERLLARQAQAGRT